MLVAVLIAANGVFVAGEFALVAVDRGRLADAAEHGRRAARLAQGLLARLSFHLSGAQFGITVTSLVLGFIAGPVIASALEPLLGRLVGEAAVGGVAVAVALVLATVVQMVLGELVPKNLAIARPLESALRLAPALHLYGLVFGPVIRLLDGAANRVVRLLGIEPTEELSTVRSVPELSLLVTSSARHGTITDSASELFRRSIRFTEKRAADVLVPRLEVKAVAADAPLIDLVALADATGHSRFPVSGADLDDLVGVVHVKELHRIPHGERASARVEDLARPAIAVGETVELPTLLRTMRESRAHLLVVVDEHGATAGIVTLEDLVEEIVGEIDDEYDRFTPGAARQVRPGVFLLSGLLHLDEVEELIGLRLEDGEYETLAGFVLHALGRVPVEGESVEVAGTRFEAAVMDRRRVAQVLVTPSVAEDP